MTTWPSVDSTTPTADASTPTADGGVGVGGGGGPPLGPLGVLSGNLDVYDNGNGSLIVAWPALTNPPPDSYNVYLNGVFNQSVVPSGVALAKPLLTEGGLEILTESGLFLALESGGATGGGNALVTIAGLKGASYNPAGVAPPGDGSNRPENLPPTGLITDAQTCTIQVTAVIAGVEVIGSIYSTVTVQPASVMLVTPMRRPFPFPSF